MALSVNFTATQSAANPNEITLTDTSTGSDGTITTRRVYIATADGTYLVESGTSTDYEVWALPLATNITLDVLTEATSPNITVQWLAGNTVVYSKTTLFDFNLQIYLALIGLTQTQLSNPNIVQDTTYYGNKIQLMVNAKDSETAVTYNDDIYLAQSALDRANYMVENSDYYF